MITIFITTLNQIAFLFLLIALGFILTKAGFLQEDAAKVLAKLETMIFIPAVVFKAMTQDFTIEKIQSAGTVFIISFVAILIVIPCALLLAKPFSKDRYLRRVYAYGFAFSNSGYMGNAVAQAVFPEHFFEYVISTLPLLIMTYAWAIPVLLIPDTGVKHSFKDRLKSFANPMFISILVGILIGLAQIKLPVWVNNTVSSSAACMSPVAMLLTGITFAGIDLKKTFSNLRIYIASFLRLIVIPLVFFCILYLLKAPKDVAICIICAVAMPLGLNMLIIPKAYSEDVPEAAGLTIVSHLLGCITIPIIFTILNVVLL